MIETLMETPEMVRSNPTNLHVDVFDSIFEIWNMKQLWFKNKVANSQVICFIGHVLNQHNTNTASHSKQIKLTQ